MDNLAKILRLVAEGIAAMREVAAIFEASVSAATQINAEGREITDAELEALRATRNAAFERLKQRVS